MRSDCGFARNCHAQASFSLLMFVAALGCGDSTQQTPVEGDVSVAGVALPGGSIQFFPATGERPVSGVIAKNGSYQVGLAEGEYKVAIRASAQLPEGWKEGDPVPPPQVVAPARYAHPKRSPLSLVVGAGADQRFDCELN